MELDDTLEGFWLSRRRNFSKHTIADYERTFQRLREFLGNREFGSITATELDHFLDYVEEKYHLSDKTLLNHWTALSSLWTWAEQALGVKQIVRNRVERPKPFRRQSSPYTEAELRALLDACEYMDAWSTKHGKYVKAHRPSGIGPSYSCWSIPASGQANFATYGSRTTTKSEAS